ncbi:bifunctional proline dehydrogenase/L-glutamate gamma-semialdehyde dehydrogenase PutA [Roseinatronobacter bogoriensis]|uniref:Bifunctional protein PutA n=1 Tax=Roseinatronobacter bogoriensis subsp. barguzinensis TaxID=441209 RepID=A0A2K8KIM1_9RHOB|nr:MULTISPECIES: bifunctional proline dehydrogenase/L-glutamate gamma-semialdehyde dehydrogenase PutA [Rhodobaca]ATX67615.1 bifunctional proline dehydrogenase/L-glutamate gamma-semialdehyde dehydrogenase PutA [Rhodobaca barguzinensis]MBB4208569.1 RHH-type proline utilization regulon transcriptional repressor/proline dehydrogenase/delta 1-pyrroline-5-carboxylate dehydrogenase [Rhodobaca bogoriensis DSM 18756]TDW38162.1 L-proline dehydrogenase /delta-1-pyrroline-5-carboxylate dehydrogenase [Rhodob
MQPAAQLPIEITHHILRDEAQETARAIHMAALDSGARADISQAAAKLVQDIRASDSPGLMEVFLAEYGLSTEEGIALMCLAEALLRVPDAATIDDLIEDKIAPSDWGRHLGKSSSSLVNASTWALMLTGRVLDDRSKSAAQVLRGAVKRLGEPVIRTAVGRAMKEMGRQFVLGETIDTAMTRAKQLESRGYSYSYDMLGEAARTDADAKRYHTAYAKAIRAIGARASGNDIRSNPGISVKLSALHPRYEMGQSDRVMTELVPRVRELARLAAALGLGFNIDAEEADRLALSLDVIGAVLADPALEGWDGFGVVVQAYGPRAGDVIDWLHAQAERLDRKLMVRLVKGAYWDTEIKRAQVFGLDGFPVLTQKPATDINYIACARQLLAKHDRLYPQFATHNAHTVAAVLHMAEEMSVSALDYEFQRLHGMGEKLHDIVLTQQGTRCRIYAPVGAHKDLLAYLVRRLLENGANSSFVNQIVDEDVPPAEVAACPFVALEMLPKGHNPKISTGPVLFGAARRNARGWDLSDQRDLDEIDAARAPFREACFKAAPLIAGKVTGAAPYAAKNPARPTDHVGEVTFSTPEDVDTALAAAKPWAANVATRAEVLNRAADLYEAHFGEIFAILGREAGKSQLDAVGELREAVDFLRYYALQAQNLAAPARGIFTCISPWNFPLAIFTGQIAGALAAGNGVLAKPAEQTPLIAHLATRLLHEAGVPRDALQLLPGDGATVGAALTSDPRVNGVAFTGSTETALVIRRAMAQHLNPGTPLIAETGGLNAMIVDSTALPEQAVRDVLASSFQSAGQRCSALRCLYVQEDIAQEFRAMLFGAMDELRLGDPWALYTDVGPVIDAQARDQISAYIESARAQGRVLHELATPDTGFFVPPVVLSVSGIKELEREVFGPVLHLATFKAADLDRVIADVNATGYGLTFGLHTRIDSRVQHVVERIRVGNTYVNRNQIGAIVGSQPFGGEGLSGTGPKAGGPHYLTRFTREEAQAVQDVASVATVEGLRKALANATGATLPDVLELPGPTGESNRLSFAARAPILCMGPGPKVAQAQAKAVQALGGAAAIIDGVPDNLAALHGYSGVLFWGDTDQARAIEQALAERDGPILPLITDMPDAGHVFLERHLCVDTTASGGNAQLLAETGGAD